MKQWPLVASFILFIALCASVAYWAMQVFTPPVRPAVAPPPTAQAAPNLDAAATLFGGRSNVAVASNFQLKGVIFSGDPASSVAILATDGKPPQAIRANAEVMPGVTVKEVHRQYVLLSDGGVIKRVELPDEVKSDGTVTAATKAPAPAPAPSSRTAPSPPPRVVVNPPVQSQSATPSPAPQSVPQATVAPNVPQQAASPASPALPANTRVAPVPDMGGPSIGYNPAGAQAASPPSQAPSPPSAASMQGGMPATPPAIPSQAMPQSQTTLPTQPGSGLPAPSSQQR